MQVYLEFEKPIAEMEGKIAELRAIVTRGQIKLQREPSMMSWSIHTIFWFSRSTPFLLQ